MPPQLGFVLSSAPASITPIAGLTSTGPLTWRATFSLPGGAGAQPENLSFTFQDEVYKKHAKVYDELADKIFKDLGEEKMAELNAKVDVEGQSAQQVAQKYLEDIGVL